MALVDVLAEREEKKEEMKMILEDISFDAESILEVEPYLLNDRKFLRKAVYANGDCLLHLDPKYRKNIDFLVLAARTNPKFLEMIPAQELFKKNRWFKVLTNMQKRAHELKKMALEDNPEISHAELKEIVGTYLKTARQIFREKYKEFVKIRKSEKVQSAKKKQEKKLEKNKKKLEKLTKQDETLSTEVETINQNFVDKTQKYEQEITNEEFVEEDDLTY